MEPFEIGIAILQFVSERQGSNEGHYADFADFDPKTGCHSNVP